MSKLKPLYLYCVFETEKGVIPITIRYDEIQSSETDEFISKVSDELEKRMRGDTDE